MKTSMAIIASSHSTHLPPPPPPPQKNFPLKQPFSASRLAALLIFALCAFAAPTSYAQTPATVVSVSATDGFYKVGDPVSVVVTFSEEVTVSGSGNVVGLRLLTSQTAVPILQYASLGTTTLMTLHLHRTHRRRHPRPPLRQHKLAFRVWRCHHQNRHRRRRPDLAADRLRELAVRLLGGGIGQHRAGVPDAASSSDPLVLPTIATSSTAATTVYNAEATDFAGTADTGITYTLGGTGTDPDSFSLDTDTGVLTPAANDPAEGTYTLTLTATDEAENVSDTHYLRVMVAPLPTVTITDNIVIGTPDTRLTDTANSADGALTFTFMFREDVTGFETGDITVTGGSKGGVQHGHHQPRLYAAGDSDQRHRWRCVEHHGARLARPPASPPVLAAPPATA